MKNVFEIIKLKQYAHPKIVYEGTAHFGHIITFEPNIGDVHEIEKMPFHELENVLKTKYQAYVILPIYFHNNILSLKEEIGEQIGFIFMTSVMAKNIFNNNLEHIFNVLVFNLDCYNAYLNNDVYNFNHYQDDKLVFKSNHPQFYGQKFVNDFMIQMRKQYDNVEFVFKDE